MKKNILYILVFLFGGWCKAYAQHQLVVELNNSSTVRYMLSDNPVVTFSGTQVSIKSAKAEASYTRSSIKRYYFEDAADGIEEVKTPSSELRIQYTTPEQVKIYGLTSADNVRIYDITGKRLSAEISNSVDAVSINLSSLSSGVYIITLPNHPSIKIKK